MAKRTTKKTARRGPRRAAARQDAAVVPALPKPYRDGRLPPLPPREEIVMIGTNDDRMPAGVQSKKVSTVPSADGGTELKTADQKLLDLMLEETRKRDDFTDRALVELLAMIEGRPLTDNLLQRLRLRLRKLGDDVHALTRVATAYIVQRERVTTHCDVDPANVCRAVEEKKAGGSTVTAAFLAVATETGKAVETIRNAYYKHRKTPRA